MKLDSKRRFLGCICKSKDKFSMDFCIGRKLAQKLYKWLEFEMENYKYFPKSQTIPCKSILNGRFLLKGRECI